MCSWVKRDWLWEDAEQGQSSGDMKMNSLAVNHLEKRGLEDIEPMDKVVHNRNILSAQASSFKVELSWQVG